MGEVHQLLGEDSWLARALHHVHQEICWQTQLGTLNNAAELRRSLKTQCASVLQDVTAAAILHSQPLAEAEKQQLDVWFNTELCNQQLRVERLSHPLVSLTFPNLALSRERLEHSLSAGVARFIMRFIDGDSVIETLQQLPVTCEGASDWQQTFSECSKADAAYVAAHSASAADSDTGDITCRIRKQKANTLARNDVEVDIDLAHCLKAMLSSDAGDNMTKAAAAQLS